MKVFKFGGASINSVDRIKNIKNILSAYTGERVLVVVSAMGKTTNALEKVTEAFFEGKNEEALQLFDVIRQHHLTLVKYLLTQTWKKVTDDLMNFFTEVEWLLHDKPVKSYDYYYDQVVCIGEMLSSTILSATLAEEGIPNKWIDVRDLLRTDDNFRDANVQWDTTSKNINSHLLPAFASGNMVITQGFVGCTDENESTTLGREGSDYTAAVFASLLNAESVTIWKDVEGVMNADPKKFPEAKYISALSYTEVIEMAYYGAQVIHPKTIKPLQNKNIPLLVKSFVDPSLPGTLISKKAVHDLPPIIVVKENQVLLNLSSKDFSFVGEKPVAKLYEIFAEIRMRPNLTQNAAISLMCCVDDIPEKIEQLALEASSIFDVQVEKGLSLLTVRHYNEQLLQSLTSNKNVVLEQKTKEMVQCVYRP